MIVKLKRKCFFASVICVASLLLLTACSSNDLANVWIEDEDKILEEDTIEVCGKIAQNIECSDYETAIELCNQLEDVSQDGKKIVMEALVETLNSQMASTLKSFCTSTDLVDERRIEKFKQYKAIVDQLDITEDEYTNVDKYIDLVLSTENCLKYDPLWCLINEVKSDFDTGNYYFDLISTSYGDYTKDAYAELACASFQKCYEVSLNYSTVDFGIYTTREVFKYYVDGLTDFLNYGEFAGNSQLADEWEQDMDEAQMYWNELADTIGQFPTSVYYGK